MSDHHQQQTQICTVDPYQYLQIKQNQDGTITRLMEFPCISASPDPTSSSPVISKDFPLNSTHNTFLRMFLPKIAFSDTSKKLPIIIYFHGGGFVVLHANSVIFHAFCSALASHLPAIVVSVEYRPAPEHRLPAAYDDALEALQWICASENPTVVPYSRASEDFDFCGVNQHDWLSKYGDFNYCFLMGSSAGGNIAYHAALRCLDDDHDLEPLRLKGLILHQPFFGGSDRTGSELRLANDPYLPLSVNDLFWELALPIGSDRDHEYSNSFSGSGRVEKIKEMGWRVLVTGCDRDPLVDRLMEFVKMLKGKGVGVKGNFSEDGHHGLEIMDLSKSEPLFRLIKNFTDSC